MSKTYLILEPNGEVGNSVVANDPAKINLKPGQKLITHPTAGRGWKLENGKLIDPKDKTNKIEEPPKPLGNNEKKVAILAELDRRLLEVIGRNSKRVDILWLLLEQEDLNPVPPSAPAIKAWRAWEKAMKLQAKKLLEDKPDDFYLDTHWPTLNETIKLTIGEI